MPDIRHSIQISAPPEAVYNLVATAGGLAQWWAEDVTGNDGAVDLGFVNRTTVYRLRLRVRDAPNRFEWVCETGHEWSGTRLLFDLAKSAGGTLPRLLTQTVNPKRITSFPARPSGELIFRLKAAAEGQRRGPLFLSGSLAY